MYYNSCKWILGTMSGHREKKSKVNKGLLYTEIIHKHNIAAEFNYSTFSK